MGKPPVIYASEVHAGAMKKLINGEMLTIDEAWSKHKNLCWKYVRCNLDRARRMSYTRYDVEQTAALAFTKAYNDFNPDAGVRFSTYAIPVIFGMLDNEFSRKNAGIQYSTTLKKLAYDFLKGKDIQQRRETQLDDIMNTLHIDYFRAYEVFQFIHSELLLSMDKPATVDKHAYERHGTQWDIIGKEADYSSIFVEEVKSICTEKENEVINLIVAGVERRDIHAILNVPPTAIYSRIVRIKQRIKEKGLLHDGQTPNYA